MPQHCLGNKESARAHTILAWWVLMPYIVPYVVSCRLTYPDWPRKCWSEVLETRTYNITLIFMLCMVSIENTMVLTRLQIIVVKGTYVYELRTSQNVQRTYSDLTAWGKRSHSYNTRARMLWIACLFLDYMRCTKYWFENMMLLLVMCSVITCAIYNVNMCNMALFDTKKLTLGP